MDRVFPRSLLLGSLVLALLGTAMIWSLRPLQPRYQGKTIEQWLNLLSGGTGSNDNPLRLERISNSEMSDWVTFKVPLKYDLLQKYDLLFAHGKLCLVIDGELAPIQECLPAIDGTCLMKFNAGYYPPGPHSIHARISIGGLSGTRPVSCDGPPSLCMLSNIVVSDRLYSQFNDNEIEVSAIAYDSNLVYNLELRSENGSSLYTNVGRVTNGLVKAHWNLKDATGTSYQENLIKGIFKLYRNDSLFFTKTQDFIREPSVPAP